MSSKTLLFADDSATMRLIMEKTFQGEDFQVITVPSGQAAIEKARELTPDIVIADAGMSGVSGYDVCEAIRKDGALSGIPVVIMSGISNPYDESRGKSINATEHIKKPFDTTKLIDRVKELCTEAVSAPVAAMAASGPGVAPARPNFNLPPMPRKDAFSDTPNANATLHAFPRPGLPDESVRPVQPFAVNAPARASETQPSISAAPSYARVNPNPEPEPIEIAEEESATDIQVGTLAELAQMNAQGGKVPQEVRDDAIELDAPAASISDAAARSVKAISSAGITSSPVQKAVSRAAEEIAAGVGGLTTEQAQAIMQLAEDVVEKVVWEVVPDLAEAIIREKLDELLNS